MKGFWKIAALVLAWWSICTAVWAQTGIMGFSGEAAAEQRKWEELYDSLLDRTHLDDWMRRMTARPHHVGSPFGKENADFVARLFQSWGYDVSTETFYVLFPTPEERELTLLEPETYSAALVEPVLENDSTSSLTEGRLPPYNAYSADGDVTGELVYVNYGIPEDYEELERRGIDVQGKIVIARYGGSWRGIKPKVAAEKGAVGCILYSDPRDDGYFQGDTYPDGPYRNSRGAQRGSVADMPLFPGDPLTPGTPATKDAERLPLEEAPTLTKIPVLPVSYDDALPFLKALGGPVAPVSWRGALPITYHLGPGPAKARLKLKFNWDLQPAYNVIARLEGNLYPDQWVLRGNHRDAWAFGAADPISGMIALLEEARAIAELASRGWRPARTLVFASWDAEEPGLLGSTEWAEMHSLELKEKAVAYINSDGNGRGFLRAGGSHTLEPFVNEVARVVEDPQTGVSVARRLQARRRVQEDPAIKPDSDFPLAPLGSGSDYTPFLQHLGIASLNISYGGENGGGSYHSIFDSYDHYSRFGDPDFQYGITQVQTTGRLTMRLAAADVLPFRFGPFVDHVAEYLEEIISLSDEMRKEAKSQNQLIENRDLVLAADPTLTYIPPDTTAPVPHINFAPLQNAVESLMTAAHDFDQAIESADLSAELADPGIRQKLNQLLLRSERNMTDPEGLPQRPWFQHQIYAPGFYTGYGVKTLPTVREAVEQKNWSRAEERIVALAETLANLESTIREATDLLQ